MLRRRKDVKKLYGPTKTDRTPKAPIIPEAMDWVMGWANVPEEMKIAMRNAVARNVIGLACKKTFPGRSEKHLTFHDLRDCYAIHLLRHGLRGTQVARAIGDNETTFFKHYADFIMSDEEVDDAVATLKTNRNLLGRPSYQGD
jgi:integrase